ncbi:hypothetical protein BDW02DRAFT_313730 [Decorospora gaudefroyi]|uniref:Secreted protein n=1 Tax=Decorospora gaudefroyi TaxID=184978 RepID=A0A6A5KHK1_9PLEO|nr:hypothetical protein BDW02DRAFT_313730 [Decorospora gaudefroyi]
MRRLFLNMLASCHAAAPVVISCPARYHTVHTHTVTLNQRCPATSTPHNDHTNNHSGHTTRNYRGRLATTRTSQGEENAAVKLPRREIRHKMCGLQCAIHGSECRS